MIALVAMAFLLNLSSSARAWGERGHELVNAAAVENLPEPLRCYFLPRKAFLVEHAIDPDRLAREDPEELRHHYTEVEAYDPYPFLAFKKQFIEERRGPTPLALEHGDSLWQIERFTQLLAEAFRRRQWEQADRAAVFAAHYACDLTQPLHTVVNYDGQLTGQNGIHARFETGLVKALADRWVFEPRPAENQTNLRARIFSEYLRSYRQRNLIFAADRIAVFGRNYQDPQFFHTFDNLIGLLAKKRLEAAISFVSSLWYTAWVRAGKPVLPPHSGAGKQFEALGPGVSRETQANRPGCGNGDGSLQPKRIPGLPPCPPTLLRAARRGNSIARIRKGRVRGYS